jgi:hypothetical protein
MTEFLWWQNALAGKRGPIHDGDPQSGFYRQRNRDKVFEPVAYWKDSATGEQRCHVNGKAVDRDRMMHIWPFASKNPITDKEYWHRMDTGKWIDEDAGARDAANGPDIDPATDPVGSMKAEIQKAAAGIDVYKTIDSDEQGAKAQTLRSALTTLAGKADKAREAAKAPHWEKCKQVDAEWQPVVKLAKDHANDIRKALEAWENVKRDNARLAAQAAEKAAREAQEAGKPAPPPPASNTPPPAMQIRGASGRAASVGTKKVIVSVDLQKCWEKLGGLPEVYNLFLELADKAISAGRCTAEELGAVIEEKASVR